MASVTSHEGLSDHKLILLEIEIGKLHRQEKSEPKFVLNFDEAMM